MSEFERSPPLRASKKQQTRSDLLANAIALFRRKGIRATRSAEISAAAGVSPATLFNYFPTKNDLADAWVRGELAEQLTALERAKGDRSLRAALRELCREIAAANWPERQVRFQAWRAAGRAPADRSEGLRPLKAWVGREQGKGRLRSDLPSETLADMVLEALESGLVQGIQPDEGRAAEDLQDPGRSGGAGSAGELSDLLRARVDLVLDGARKKNERVELSSDPSSVRRSPRGPA